MFNSKTYYQWIRTRLLEQAKYYYLNKEKRLQEQAQNKYREISEEKKDIKREYGI